MLPKLIARIAFASDAFAASPSWSDVSSYLRSLHVYRGRQDTLDRFEAGRARLVLYNTDLRFWPKNTGGAYSPNVLPGKRLNLRAIYPTVLAYDTFNRADTAGTLGIGETFHTWTIETGDVIVQSNQAKASDISVSIATLNAGVAGSVQASCIWRSGALGKVGLVTRWADSSNYIRFYIDSTQVIAHKIVAAAVTQLGFAAFAPVDNTAYALRIDYNGNDLSFYKDDVLQFSATVTNLATNTRHGLYGQNGTSFGPRWDNFAVKPVGAEAGNPVLYDLFTGYIETWDFDYLGSLDAGPIAIVQARDALANLANVNLNDGVGYAQERSDVRVGNVLDDISWPAGDRTLGVGYTNVQASGAIANVNALTHLRAVEATEGGQLWLAPDGKTVFQERYDRALDYATSQAIYGDGGGAELQYRQITWKHRLDLVYNDIRLTRTGGSEQTASDATSQSTYGKRTYVLTGLLHTADAEVGSLAQHILSRRKNAEFRVGEIGVAPERNPTNLWPDALAFDISTRITVRNDDASVDDDYHIEAVEHVVDAIQRAWETRWTLSPATEQAFWVLGDAVNSVLGTTTRLGY